jgi:NifU-like domain
MQHACASFDNAPARLSLHHQPTRTGTRAADAPLMFYACFIHVLCLFHAFKGAGLRGAAVSPINTHRHAAADTIAMLPFHVLSLIYLCFMRSKVLDEVRPYLIADGGNCRVVSVDAETRCEACAPACGSGGR